MKFVEAVFGKNLQEYSYMVPEGDNPEMGDMIVTSVEWGDPIGIQEEVPIRTLQQTRSFADGCRVATVVGVGTAPKPKATKFYLWLIPTRELRARYDQNRALLELRKRQDAAKVELDRMLREQDSLAMYERLAESNPKAKELLDLLRGGRR